MAAIRSFVTIKPIATKTSVGTNLNEIRKGINRTGLLMEGIAKNYAETAKLIQFEREWLRNNAQSKVADINEEEKKEQSLFAKSMQNLRKVFSKKQRDEAEAATEGQKQAESSKVAEEVKKPVKSFLEAIGSLLGTIGKYFLIFGALNWLESNPESAVKFFKLVWAIGKFSFQLTKLGIGGVMDGLTNLFGDFSSNGMKENVVKRGLRFFIGALQLAGGLAMLRFASYLIMPWRLFQDVNTIKSVFLKQAQSEAEMKASAEARKTGYKDSRTGIVYTKEEYEAIKKSARRADEKRAKRAGKGYKSDLYQNDLNNRFQAQYQGKPKGRLGKLQQRGRIAGKQMTRSISKFAKANPGKVAAGFSVLGGGLRIASGLATGESAGKAVGAGVGQAAGGILGGIAGTALLGPFLGPFAPIVGNAIGSFLGEWVGGVLGPIVEPIFKPIGRYFGMLFEVIGAVMEPFQQAFGELFSALFDFVGQIGNLVMQVATILWDFYKFVYGPIFNAIGDVVGFVVNNAKRLMDPGSVAQGVADAFTFNIFDFDKKNKKAAGGPVDAPSRAMGGPIGPMSVTQAPVLAAVGNTMLDAVVGGIGGFGFAGSKALGFISGDVARLRTTFGTTGGVGVSGSPRGALKTAITLQKTTAAGLDGDTKKTASEELYRAVSDEDKGLKGVLLKAIRIFDANYGKADKSSGGGGGGSGGGGGGGGGADLTAGPIAPGPMHQKGANIAKELMRLLSIKDYQAAGIVGNLIQESSLVPDRIQGSGMKRGPLKVDGVTGYSYPQWTSRDRQQSFANYMQKQGHDWRTKGATDALATGFLATEFKGYMSSVFTGTKDVAAASNWVLKNYEKPADQGPGEQKERAQDSAAVLAKMAKGGKVLPKRYSLDGMGEPPLDAYKKVEEKVQEKQSIQGFSKGGVLSTNGRESDLKLSPQTPFSQYRKHHGKPDTDSYNNSRLGGLPVVPRDYVVVRDFGNQGLDRGSPVVAGVDGKVVTAGGSYNTVVINSGGKNRVQFHHFDSITARVGQMVTSSTIIGKQGNKPSGAVHVHLDATPSDHRSWAANQLGGKFDAASMSEAETTGGGDTSGGGGGGGGGEAPQEPETVESMQKKLEDLLNQFGKAMQDTTKGFQLPAQEKPQTSAPAATPSGSIQPATSVNAEQLRKAKEMEAKAVRDKESDMFVPTPTIIQQTVQQPVINNVGQSNTVVVRGTPSPMLTGRPRRTNH
jgi:hypothetical protein